ncbi:transporter substrate-binding domain-containing protein [Arthrobacter sp. 260]|uniref:transporter substrate-binding domain-containing protein n=1 Tax=Arthrobacter sp. 260 TaxID=2735314 RepID=UPI00320832C9
MLFAVLSAVMLAGCGISIPADPEGTLDRVSGGTMRVGVSENGRWVELDDGTGPRGVEPDLVREYADRIDAEVEWVEGAEHELMDQLKHGQLDLVIAGLSDKTPWHSHGSITKPYAETRDERGETVKHVMAAPLGENAFVFSVEQFLLTKKVAL